MIRIQLPAIPNNDEYIILNDIPTLLDKLLLNIKEGKERLLAFEGHIEGLAEELAKRE